MFLSIKTNVNDDEQIYKTKKAQNIIKAFGLSTAYSSVIGGFGTLIGASSNIVLKEYFDKKHPKSSLNFFTFMIFSLPISILLIISTWLILCILWFPNG